MIFGWIFIALLVILALWYFTRGDAKSPENYDNRDSAPEILQKRYARGEINKEEFEEQKQKLREKN